MTTVVNDEGALILDDAVIEAEFRMACHQAVTNNLYEFEFEGLTIETATAVDVIFDIMSERTYH